jgi:epoxide hydrolase-like predicted phosphatase
MKIQTVFFDVGGVLAFTDFPSVYRDFSSAVGLTPEFVADFHKNNWDDLILGNITLNNFFSHFAGPSGLSVFDLENIWKEAVKKNRSINTELYDYVKELKGNFQVGILSNLSFSRKLTDEAMSLYKGFDPVILSCVEHLKKPDPKFYELALKKTNCQASEAVFIDDKERSTFAAKKLGLIDILYTDNSTLFGNLRRLGL